MTRPSIPKPPEIPIYARPSSATIAVPVLKRSRLPTVIKALAGADKQARPATSSVNLQNREKSIEITSVQPVST